MGVDYSHRMGSMEIQVAVHPGLGRELVTEILHSKILHGLWPDLEEIQERFIKVLRHQRMLQIKEEVPKKKLDFTISKNVTAIMIPGTNQMMLQDNVRSEQSAGQSPGKRKKKKRASLNVNAKKPPPPKPPLVVPWDKDAKVFGRTNKTLSMRVLGFHRADDVEQRTYSPTNDGPETSRSTSSAYSPHRHFFAGIGARSPVKNNNNNNNNNSDQENATKNNTASNTNITTNITSNNNNNSSSNPSSSSAKSSVKFADVANTTPTQQSLPTTLAPSSSSASASSSSSTVPQVRSDTGSKATAATSVGVSLTDPVEVCIATSHRTFSPTCSHPLTSLVY